MMNTKIILASASPRRRMLLQMLGLKFDVLPASCEPELDADLSIPEAVKMVALYKANSIRSAVDNAIIIAADTVVAIDNAVFGKPTTIKEARTTLERLSGRTHCVYTALAIVCANQVFCEIECTRVSFRCIKDCEIDSYIKTGEPMDKAGAYAAQGLGAIFIDRIEGDFYNVVGLPLRLLDQMLKDAGVNILEGR